MSNHELLALATTAIVSLSLVYEWRRARRLKEHNRKLRERLFMVKHGDNSIMGSGSRLWTSDMHLEHPQEWEEE